MKKFVLLLLLIIPFQTYAHEKWHFTPEDLKQAGNALSYAEKKDWRNAFYYAGRARDPIIKKIITFLRYRDKGLSFDFGEVAQFIYDNPHWPEQQYLINLAERSLDNNTHQGELAKWFQFFPPQTGQAFKYYVALRPEADIIKKAWINSSFTADEELEFLAKYGDVLTQEDHVARLDALIWMDRLGQARRLFDKIDQDHLKLFSAVIAFSGGVNLTNTVPEHLRHHPSLLYNLAKWYDQRSHPEHVINILRQVNYQVPHADQWWKLRIKYVRNLMEEKKYHLAYELTKHHYNTDLTKYVEAEWLAGFLSLRFLNDHKVAYKHFVNLYEKSNYPISISRGAYWAGRASEPNHELARHWYKIAGIHKYHFYGQLALQKLGDNYIKLAHPVTVTEQDKKNHSRDELAKAAYVLAHSRKFNWANLFLEQSLNHIIGDHSKYGEVRLLTEFGNLMQAPALSIGIAKLASRFGVHIDQISYPLLQSIPKIPITYALIRQESLFDRYAVSRAGATGLMQIMPETAQMLAKELKIIYSPHKLKQASYNVELGTRYIERMINYYNGSYVLAIAAYNGGIGNVNKWIVNIGDPRDYQDLESVIDWIELVPFYETRNYVQRVLENLQIYNVLIGKKHSLNLTEYLMR